MKRMNDRLQSAMSFRRQFRYSWHLVNQFRRMAWSFNNVESLQQRALLFFTLTISKARMPTSRMGRHLAQICSIQISTFIMV